MLVGGGNAVANRSHCKMISYSLGNEQCQVIEIKKKETANRSQTMNEQSKEPERSRAANEKKNHPNEPYGIHIEMLKQVCACMFSCWYHFESVHKTYE